MKFNEFVDKYGFSFAILARELGVTHHAISRIYNGVYPRPDMQRKIVEWTCGLVSANELIGLPREIKKKFKFEEKLKNYSIRKK